MMGIAIYGAGGFGREVVPIAREMLRETGQAQDDVVFVSDREELHNTSINGIRVLPPTDLTSLEFKDYSVVIALADAKARREIAERCQDIGLKIGSVHSPFRRIYDNVKISEGAIICDYSIITSDVVIGKHFHCNLYSYVAHECVVGDFVTLAPRVCINGRVIVEDDVYIGTGAIIRDGKPNRPLVIGKGAVIGMGAVVTRDVPPGATVVGNPARPLER